MLEGALRAEGAHFEVLLREIVRDCGWDLLGQRGIDIGASCAVIVVVVRTGLKVSCKPGAATQTPAAPSGFESEQVE